MYQALYRKWRPRTFDDVAGQEQVTETLKNQIINGRLSHAYLFVGTRGTGKTTCAKILARAVNCERPENGNPCNKCKSCLGIEDGSVLDVVELDAASNNGVDNVRALRDEAIYSPVSVRKRVYIIDEVHMLSTSAFNALLKILEEPPEHLMFILATTELQKVPATVLSRCQRHVFKRIRPQAVAERLKYVAEQEGLNLEQNAADLLARLADGSMRDGLSLLDQCSGVEDITMESILSAMGLVGNLQTIELLNAVSKSETERALSVFSSMWGDGKAPATLLTELSNLLRDILMLKVAPKGGVALLSGGFDLQTLKDFSSCMSAEEIISHIDSIHARVGALRDGRDPKTAAELCIIGLCEQDLGESIGTLRARVAKLESVIKNGAVIPASKNQQPEERQSFEAEAGLTQTEDDRPPLGLYEQPPCISSKDTITPPAPEEPVGENCSPAYSAQGEPVGSDHAPIKDEHRQAHESAIISGAWGEILAELNSTMPVSLFIHLKDAHGEIQNGTLTIAVKDSFQQTQLEQETAQGHIRAALNKVNGNTLPIKVVIGKAKSGDGGRKLEDLSKFENVKFE